MREGCEIVADDHDVRELLHVHVVVENRRRPVELELAKLQGRARPRAVLGPKLRNDLRRSAEQRKDTGLLGRPSRGTRERG